MANPLLVIGLFSVGYFFLNKKKRPEHPDLKQVESKPLKSDQEVEQELQKSEKPKIQQPEIETIKSIADFQKRVIEASLNNSILVEFSAEWCKFCKTMDSMLKALNLDFKINIFTVDLDLTPEISEKYNINSIPHLIMFTNGLPTKELKGIPNSQSFLEEFIIENFNKSLP